MGPSEPMTLQTPVNLALAVADTQYVLTIPKGAKHFSFFARGGADFRWALADGKVAGPTAPYLTAPYTSPEKMETVGSDLIVYFATDTGGTVIELVYWM